MPKFMETRPLTLSANSTDYLPEEKREQTREGSRGKYGRCQAPDCSSQTTGELRRIAAHGLCFSCYRRQRESNREDLLLKRRSHGASYARRAAISKKLYRKLSLLESLKEAVVSALEGKIPEALLDGVKVTLTKELRKITSTWNVERDRQLKLILDMERIEEAGGVPVVVASDQVLPEVTN